MFERILVPTDRSDPARRAIEQAADLATRYGATVTVLNVVDTRELDGDSEDDERTQAARTELKESLDDADFDMPIEAVVRAGIPSEEILDYADEAGADLLVMGTHGRTGVRRYLLGSVAEKVVRLSDVPVLSVHPAEVDVGSVPYERILVPTDGSDGASVAVDCATDLATTYGAELHAVSVVDTGAMAPDVQFDVIMDQLQNRAQTAVETVTAAASKAGVEDTQTAMLEGRAHDAIESYAEDERIDLIVMGTHGRSGLDRYLLGSVAEKLVRTASVPVLTVRMPDAE
ncbi:universal stress protein [Halorientalis pallida]|uniref:Universal stress protein n=1 Tax=Halorientalis pallida TaxID=2479928 RepID=A0A498KU34_9EURY|nr:universal stress protein [Halorientalis pallida]RXK46874.1 universal stress protein [Halorientalis pallida]